MKVETINLTKSYRDADKNLTVIDDVTCRFLEGKFNCIVGRSGIGKSTFLHLLGALDSPTSGQIVLGDLDVSQFSKDERAKFRGKNVGFIFQFHHLLPEFNAVENVMMPLIIAGKEDREAENQALSMLEEVGLKKRALHRPGELSGGEQQRVAIARAVVHKPSLLLADEPTGNLDTETANVISELLINLTKNLGTTTIIVTHSIELAKRADLVFEMQPGGELRRRD